MTARRRKWSPSETPPTLHNPPLCSLKSTARTTFRSAPGASFASWGEALASQSEPTIAVVGLDYFFITTEGVLRRNELAIAADDKAALEDARGKGTFIKCFIVRCMQSKCIFAHVVP